MGNRICGVDLLDGQDITSIFTQGSMYDHNCVNVLVRGKPYKLSCEVILAMVDMFYFDKEKARKHTYLTKPQPKCDELGLVPLDNEGV